MRTTVDSPPRANPFPGLRPFRSDEHHLFFGREEQTAALLQLLRTNRFLAVVGTSGSGKSSLVRAGMIAELHGGTMTQAGSTWEVLVLRPGGNPVENLARAFVDADLYDREDAGTLPRLLATLKRSRFGLVEAMKQSEVFEPGTNLLVVVDQFEELFRFRQQGVESEETASAFVNLLLTASEQAECPIYVTITMRSDYLGDCSEIPGLAEKVNEGEYLIPRLSRDQKRDAIEKPIGVGGARISPLLAQRLLNEVGDDPDQLPVLQHALMRTWDAWSAGGDLQRTIDIGDFEATGGLGAALSNHADEIYDALPDDRHRSACAKVFKALTEKGDDNRGIRRPTRLAQLQAIAASDRSTVTMVLDAFRAAGVTFLMPGTEVELGDRSVLDLSHESLMRGWQRLRGWVEDEAQSARIFRRLLDTARLWGDGKASLFRDPDLQIGISWRAQESPNAEWAGQYGGHFETALAFLETSNAAAQAEVQARETARQRELDQARQLAEVQQLRLAQQQRSARRLRAMIGGLAVIAVIAIVACALALVANQRANTLADEAHALAEEARKAQKETASALAVVESQKAEVDDSLAKATAAERLRAVAEEANRRLLYLNDMRLAPFVLNDDPTTAEQLRLLLARHIPAGQPAGKKGAPATADLRGFEWYYHQHGLEYGARIFAGHDVSVTDGAFTPNGQVVTLDQNGQVRRWDPSSHDKVDAGRRDLPGGVSAQVRVLSPDGRLAALAHGKEVHVFDTVTGKKTCQIDSADVAYRRLIFSQDEGRLVIVDNKIRWCDALNGAVIASVDNDSDAVSSVALSADGLTLAVVGNPTPGKQFSIFRLDLIAKSVTPLPAKNFGLYGTFDASALSPDGQRIALGSKQQQGMVSVIDLTLGRLTGNYGAYNSPPITTIAFSGDGAQLATADTQGTIKIWDAPKGGAFGAYGRMQRALRGHQGAIHSVGFSSDGKRLISTSLDKTARVWDLEIAGTAIRPLEGALNNFNNRSLGARFSPDGLWIAAAGGAVQQQVYDAATGRYIFTPTGGGAQLWDAATGRLVRKLPAGGNSGSWSIAFSPTDSRLLAVGHGGQAGDSYVSLWDIDTGKEMARLAGATDLVDKKIGVSGVGALAFSPDGKYLVAGLGTKDMLFAVNSPMPLTVWEVASRRLIHRLDGHTGFCIALDFSSDGALLASGSRDGTAILWSTATWNRVHNLKNPDTRTLQGQGMVEDVAFAPDGKTLAMASREGNVHLWDVAAGKRLETLRGHVNAVQAVAFSPDGRTLASAGMDRTFRLWNVQMRRELMQLDPGPQMQNVQSLAFSPDGKHLLAGGFTSGLWSAARNVWDDADLAAARLGPLLKSNADFPSRIRMASENIRLHAALAKLDARDARVRDARVRAALAATRANWHASQQRWAEAAKEFDRLPEPREVEAATWLRTPGLVRLATALVHQDRPAESAMLLMADAKRRDQDGLPPISGVISFGFKFAVQGAVVRVVEVMPGSPASRSKLLPNDVIVKVNDSEIKKTTLPDFTKDVTKLLAGGVGTKLHLTVQHQGYAQTEDVDLVKGFFFADEATGRLFFPLHAALAKRLAKDPRDAGLLELRTELELAADTDFASQAAELTAVIKILAEKPGKTASAPLRRLYRRRADAYVALEKWAEAVADYAHVITPKTTDVQLLSNRARALEGVKQWDAAAADWTSIAAGNAEGAKLLAEFARRLADAGQIPLAGVIRAKARAWFEEKLAKEPENATLAAELADLLLAPRGWTVLTPAEMKAETGAKMELQKDGSVFVPYQPTPTDAYSLVFPSDLKGITGLRLEVLADPRLPKGGPGWSADGNFVLNELTLQAAPTDSPDKTKSIALRNALADFSQRDFDVRGAIDSKNNITGWAVNPEGSKNHTAIFELAEKVGDGQAARLTVRLNHQYPYGPHKLGRFRLSVSTDPAMLDRASKEFAAMKLADPWAKLAAGYALDGRHEEAVRYFSMAFKQADDYQARTWIVEYAALFEDILVALGQRHPENPQLQFTLARKLAEQGRKHLAAKQPAQAQAELEQARAVFQRLLSSGDHWRILTPVEMKTETGGNLEIQKDGSVFVRPKQTSRNDTYTLVFQSDLKGIKGLRLEVLTDPRLPQGGPGWGANGNFHLNELSLQAAPAASPDKARSIALRNAWADFSEVTGYTGGLDVRGAVDGNRRGAWSIWPQVNKDHTAVFDMAEPVGDGQAWRLTVRLSHLSIADHVVGRFRLSFTDDAATLLEARRLLNSKDAELVELDIALVKACAQQGQVKEAAVALARALEQAPDRGGKGKILAETEALPGVLAKLTERAEGDARVQAALAYHFADKGDKPLANAAHTKARALFETQLTVEPGKAALASELADLLWSTLPPVDYFWIDDAAPPGAALQGTTPWEFVSPPDHPVFRGKKSMRRQAQGESQHFFTGARGLKIGAGARLFAHVFLDPKDPPKTIMLQFNDGTIWEHRAFWGDDLIKFGNLDTESRRSMGPLPKAGGWVRLEVDATKVGLHVGSELRGWSFAQYGGTSYWDAAGTTLAFDDPWQSLAAAYHRLGDMQGLATLLKQRPAAAAGIGDLYAATQDWQRAIAEYRKAATGQPDDAALSAKLVTAYLSLAQSASDAKQFAVSTSAWAEALQADPKLSDDPQKQHRYDAACAAALAAAGRGQDEPPPDDAAKAKLRRQALDWLKAEHTSWDRFLEVESFKQRRLGADALHRWQKDANLIGIRDSAALAKIPAEERAAFNQLWSDVAALLKKAEADYGKEIAGVRMVGKGLVLQGYLDAKTRAWIYRVKLEAAKTYVIDMVSPNGNALDPYLLLRDPTGKLVAEDDDSGGGQNARIIVHAAQDGVYRIQATSFPNQGNPGSGTYSLTVKTTLVTPQSPPLYALPFKSKSDSSFNANSWITGFSSDGRSCLAAGDANSAGNVPIWNAATGKLAQELVPTNGVWYSNAKFLPGGSKYVVAAYLKDKDLYLWDTTTGMLVRKFIGHTAEGPNFVLAPDGKKLLSWNDDKTVRLWEVDTGKELKKLAGHTEALGGAAFSSDGKRILSYSPDRTLRLWDAETGQEPAGTGLKKLTLGTGAANKQAGFMGCFSPDGKQLLAYSSDSNTLELWDIGAHKSIWKNVLPLGTLTFAEIVANGRLIVGMCSDRKFRIWEAAHGKLEREIDCAPFAGSNNHEHNIATAPDGRLALASHHDGTVRVLDLASGKEIHRYVNCPLARGFSFSPDGTMAMAGSLRQGVFIFRLPPAAAAAAPITLKNGNATLEAELTRSDLIDTLRPGSFRKAYSIQLVAGKTYQIDMKQIGGLDPYLRLEDSMGTQLAFDDDSGGFPNARIVFNCIQSGTYRIIATTFNMEETGRFSLTVQQQ